ncbi:hypothetical protein [Elongatibacter sediminis]|uniref:Uncharacterized protein n=1 Tax=Elongatibacter sediminis TaxID=3119006 RepID=A0AAW9RC40_9GAMM
MHPVSARTISPASRRGLHAAVPGLLLVMALFLIPAAATAEDSSPPDFEGVWITVLVAFDDPRWRIADLVCARTGCSLEGFEYLQSLLDDPANADRGTRQLVSDMEDFQRRMNQTLLTPLARESQEAFDPSKEASLDCTPEGDSLRHQILAPLPLQIEQKDDTVTLRYEYWNAERTVHLDLDAHPADLEPTRLGHSIGHYEGRTLVVETRGLIPSETGIPVSTPLMLSPDAHVEERYTLSEDGETLDVVLNIIDPANFTRPFQNYRRMLLAPGWELEPFVCESITGEF